MDIQTQISNTLKHISAEIELAGKKEDLEAAERLAKRGSELKAFASQYRELVEKIQQALNDGRATSTNSDGMQLRRLPVQVTGGMIRQRLLLLTEHVNHRRISVGERLTIEVPASGENFTTELLPDYKLRERGAIGQFYQAA